MQALPNVTESKAYEAYVTARLSNEIIVSIDIAGSEKQVPALTCLYSGPL